MNKLDYLKRIGITREVDVSLDTLKLIQRQHVLTIPFENLDMIIDKVETNLESLFNRIVYDQRGGICYELNLLCNELLREIGFQTRVLGAKVAQDDGDYFDHLLIIVTLNNEEYIVDTSFTFFEPLRLIKGIDQNDKKGVYKLESEDDLYYELARYDKQTETFKSEYIFINSERDINAFTNRINYFESNEKSLFRNNIFCMLHTIEGKVSLKFDRFILKESEHELVNLIDSFEQFLHYLNDVIRIHYHDGEMNLIRDYWEKLNQQRLNDKRD